MRPLFILLLTLSTAVHAELTLTPAAPVVAVNERLTLDVGGAQGQVVWTAWRGSISGHNTQAVYTAPMTAGRDWVVVIDGDEAVKTVAVTVQLSAKQRFDLGKASWEVYTNRASLFTMLPAPDGERLWLGTSGGLELRETRTGKLLRLYKNLDGLPDNRVRALAAPSPQQATDWNEGLWIGTDGGLAQLKRDGTIRNWNETLQLPGLTVLALAADGAGGLLIGLEHQGLVHVDNAQQTTFFTADNSDLPGNTVYAVQAVSERDVWVGTDGGLARMMGGGAAWMIFAVGDSASPLNQAEVLALDSLGRIWVANSNPDGGLAWFNPKTNQWKQKKAENSSLPANYIKALASDGNGGMWIGTGGGYEGGVAHLLADGTTWVVFDRENAGLPSNEIDSLAPAGNGGVWVGTFAGGLAKIDAARRTHVYSDSETSIPSNDIYALASDEAGGLWIGTNPNTGLGGLARLDATGRWTLYTTANSGLPANAVEDVLSDGSGGVWVSTYSGGLAHLRADGGWDVFNTANSAIPADEVYTLAADDSGGVWLSTPEGLSRYTAAGSWETYTSANSALPADSVTALLSDGRGNLLAGTEAGLAFKTVETDWSRITTLQSLDTLTIADRELVTDGQTLDNVERESVTDLQPLDTSTDTSVITDSRDPQLRNTTTANKVRSLLSDNAGGLWIGTADSLIHVPASGTRRTYTEINGQPIVEVLALLSDGRNGLWLGTARGLAHLSAAGQWTLYDVRNSGLAGNEILALEADGSGGVWVATRGGGLARLSFGNRQALLAEVSDEAARESLLEGKRAALVIHPNGQGSGYGQAQAVDFMATYAYQTLYARGYDHDEIYFLSYRPDLDVNADAQADYNVVDGPVTLADFRAGSAARDLTVADVEAAFTWAAQQGPLDEPLLVVFIDHGLPDQLLLDPLAAETLSAQALDSILDDYQSATANPVVLVLEACHTGSLLPALSAPQRVIISSTGEDLAYYDDMGRTSFLKLYLDNLRMGDSFWQALQTVRNTIRTYRAPLNSQSPRLDDSVGGALAQSLCLNGCFGALPGVLTLMVETPAGTVQPGELIDLGVTTHGAESSVRSVWASVITPEIAGQRNLQGYSRLPAPVVNLRARDDDSSRWEGDFAEFALGGDYIFSFKARDSSGFVTEAAPITLTVTGGTELAHAAFAGDRLHIPAVTVPTDSGEVLLSADLILGGEPLLFDVDLGSLVAGNPLSAYANFDAATGNVFIPLLEVPNVLGGMDMYSATLELVPSAEALRFRMDLESLK